MFQDLLSILFVCMLPSLPTGVCDTPSLPFTAVIFLICPNEALNPNVHAIV